MQFACLSIGIELALCVDCFSLECDSNSLGTVRGTVCQPLHTPMISAGQCRCKRNVTGVQCDQCVPGTYNLRADNPDGCQCENLDIQFHHLYTCV